MFVTSLVRPLWWRSTSPGRSASPPTAFSAAATSPTTRTGQSTADRAASTDMTTAPPVMSRFIVVIASAGLMDRPPVSNVMPLPTSTTVGVRRPARLGV